MLGSIQRRFGTTMGLMFAGFLFAPAWAAPSVPRPGSLNYVEGQVSIDNQTVTSKAVGSAELNSGDTLSTRTGHAELLLTPGVYLRLADNSTVRMISPGLTNTQVELVNGHAMVEADQLYAENAIRITDRGSSTELLKKGVYSFDADRAIVAVLDGKARVTEGDNYIDLGKGKEANVGGPVLKDQKFDRKQAEQGDPLYAWSNLRSEYLSQATLSTAQTYIVDTGGWYGPGWYWNPYWSMYSFVPGDGFFYNPFGWAFYSPLYIVRSPVGYPRYFGGGRAVVPTSPRTPGLGHATRTPVMPGRIGAPSGGALGGGFRSGGFGGFHGGAMGGFHGGGFAGGRR
ncbi:MAG TPA: hypothetical protein VKU01_11300 [Bryobacteraceae bacterium]|nr:hypothetical protein [Bryobacteraceae bacterium]